MPLNEYNCIELVSYFDTPIFPNVRDLDISGRMQARSLRCCGFLIQSSQNLIDAHRVRIQSIFQYFNDHIVTYAFGHFEANSCHSFLVNIQPRPGKKSDRYSKSDLVSSMIPAFPLSFHADTHHKLSSFFNSSCVARK